MVQIVRLQIQPQHHAVNPIAYLFRVSQTLAQPSNNIYLLAVNLLNGLPL